MDYFSEPWLRAVIEELNKLDGRTWSVDATTNSYRVSKPGSIDRAIVVCGEEILKLSEGSPSRVVIDTLWRKHVYGIYIQYPKTITVAAGRDPAAVAKDIMKRLLPAYREAIAEFNKRVAAMDVAAAVAANGAAVLGIPVGGESSTKYTDTLYLDNGAIQSWNRTRVEIAVALAEGRAVADLDIRDLPTAVAKEILDLLKSRMPEVER